MIPTECHKCKTILHQERETSFVRIHKTGDSHASKELPLCRACFEDFNIWLKTKHVKQRLLEQLLENEHKEKCEGCVFYVLELCIFLYYLKNMNFACMKENQSNES